MVIVYFILVIMGLALIVWIQENIGMAIFIGGIIAILIAVFNQSNNEKRQKHQEKMNEIFNEMEERLKDRMKRDNVSFSNGENVSLKLLDRIMTQTFTFNMQVKDSNLYIIGNLNNNPLSYQETGFEDIPYYKIPITNIKYYKREGEIITKTTGKGGGSAYSLVTGWNGKVNPVEINTQITDTKHTLLYFVLNEKDVMLTFQYDDYHKFKKLLPYKDFEVLQLQQAKVDTNDDPINKLRKLSELYKENIITEDEYLAKKDELLKKL